VPGGSPFHGSCLGDKREDEVANLAASAQEYHERTVVSQRCELRSCAAFPDTHHLILNDDQRFCVMSPRALNIGRYKQKRFSKIDVELICYGVQRFEGA